MEPSLKKSRVSIMAIKASQSTTRSLANLGYRQTSSRTSHRRQSFGFSGVPGITSSGGRASQTGMEFKRPQLIYLNTYQLEPRVRWNVQTVTKASEEIINERFTGHTYCAKGSPALALSIAGELMRKVKSMNFNRYRIISVVTIGQKRAQSYNNAISFLWDYERDNYVDLQKQEHTAFIQATIFGVYLD